VPKDDEGQAGTWNGNRITLVSMAAVLFVLVALGGLAQADEDQSVTGPEARIPFSPTAEEIENAEEAADPLTDPTAALNLPHNDLARSEAATLMQSVFAPLLEMPAGIFDDLKVRSFVADNAAVIAAGDVQGLVDESASESTSEGPVLLESTIPLRTETEDGEQEAVDLSLEQDSHALEPVNPLVDVSIPNYLGEGIMLADAGISVELPNAPPDRASSVIGDSVAFYPNVATDSDLAVTPTPGGVETITQLRTPEAPLSQTFALDLPAGARLVGNEAGGAEVVRNGHQLAAIPPPSAVGAGGEVVPAALRVDGNSLVVTASPDPSVAYPIAIDPTFQDSYSWAQGYSGWTPYATPPSVAENRFSQPQVNCSNACLMLIAQYGVTYAQNSQTYWGYAVPRFAKDLEDFGKRPTTWIQTFGLSEINFNGYENWTADPMALFAVSDQNGAWRTASMYPPNLTGGYGINLNEDHSGKLAAFAMFTTKNQFLSNTRTLETRGAQIGLGDNVAPEFGSISEPGNWMNAQAGPVTTTVGDAGLGVRKLVVKTKSGLALGTTGVASSTGYGSECSGIVRNPCPREWKGAQAGNQVYYDPALAPQGITNLSVEAQDPLGNVSASTLQVKVDHDAPSLDLSGNLTEQGSVGTKLAKYTLNYTAKDGDEAAAAALTPIGNSAQLSRPMGVAVDPSGNSFVVDRLNNRVVKYKPNGSFDFQFGSAGAGDGQFNDPRGIAIAPDGTIWVADMGNDRIQAFSPSGTFLRKGKFTDPASEPYAITTGPEGVVWVTDIGLHRLVKVSENPISTLVITTGGGGTTLSSPVGAATDDFGNVWVTDNALNKVLEFNSAGNLIFQFGSAGSAPGQLSGPVGIDIAPSGNIGVVDRLNNRVQIFKPDGTYLRVFGTAGPSQNQFSEPSGISFASNNTVLIADSANFRIARWEHADQDPQSGAAKVEVKVDGKLKATNAPGCTTKNCVLNGSWTMNADEYTVGSHKVEVIPTDAVGISAPPKTLTVETHGDRTAPTVVLTGSITEQATLGKTLPAYKVKVTATDPGPAEERKSGVASIVIKVDGVTVDSASPGCPAEGCSLSREWTFKSSSVPAGWHWLEVLTTDAAGKIKTSFREFETKRDTIAPELTLSGALAEAPQGWVQEGTRSLTTDATDTAGYGVKQMRFQIDGQTVAESLTQSCELGGCAKSKTFWIDMTAFGGGAHEGVAIAEDLAGNIRKKTWTINIDPEGHISVSEATDTLEAFEDTTVLQPVATTSEFLEPEIIEAGDDPHFEESAEGFDATGVMVSVSIGDSAVDGFAVEGTAGEFKVTPVGESQATPSQLAGSEAAAVSSNSATGVDTVYRPEYNGLMLFSTIREASSPEEFSWKVHLGSGQTLKSVNSEMAVVSYGDGTEAFSITAETAKDATGAIVPTSLTVNGSDITLTVKHRSSQFVYPVVAQQEYETPYNAPTVFEVPTYEGPPPVEEGGEAGEWIPSEDAYITDAQASWFVTPNLAVVDNPPFSDDSYPQVSTILRTACGPSCAKWKQIVDNAAYKTNSADTTWWEGGTQVHSYHTQALRWKAFIWIDGFGCGYKGPLKVEKESGQHLVAFGKFNVTSFAGKKGSPTITPAYDKDFALRVWVYPNGFQEKHLTSWDGLSGYDCPTTITYNG
jgi:sugar lactone lactonase YvrE